MDTEILKMDEFLISINLTLLGESKYEISQFLYRWNECSILENFLVFYSSLIYSRLTKNHTSVLGCKYSFFNEVLISQKEKPYVTV